MKGKKYFFIKVMFKGNFVFSLFEKNVKFAVIFLDIYFRKFIYVSRYTFVDMCIYLWASLVAQ